METGADRPWRWRLVSGGARTKGRQLPLNIELEHAAIHACLKGELANGLASH